MVAELDNNGGGGGDGDAPKTRSKKRGKAKPTLESFNAWTNEEWVKWDKEAAPRWEYSEEYVWDVQVETDDGLVSYTRDVADHLLWGVLERTPLG